MTGSGTAAILAAVAPRARNWICRATQHGVHGCAQLVCHQVSAPHVHRGDAHQLRTPHALDGRSLPQPGRRAAWVHRETDHTHSLVHYPPSLAVSMSVHRLKGVSPRRLPQRYPTEVRKYL